MFNGGKLGGWFRAFLIFGLAGFLLGFLGYLVTEPPEVSQRFTERWSDFSARFPVFADLNWFNKTAPTFNRFELPTVLLVTPDAGGGSQSSDFYAELEGKLKPFSPNIISVSDVTGNRAASIDSVTPLYRKYLLVGLRTLKDGTMPHVNSQLTIGAPAYLATELFATLAADLPDRLGRFDWEQKEIANGRMITVRWNDDPEQSKQSEIAGVCLRVFEAAWAATAKGYEL